MKNFLRTLQITNTLSIDIAVGAVVSSLFFARIYTTTSGIIQFIVLGLVVLIIYNIDHLLDVKAIAKHKASTRHEFYRKHYQAILVVVTLLTCATGIVSMSLPLSMLKAGVYLILLVILYLLFQARLKFAKEFVGALIYVAGVLVPSVESVSLFVVGNTVIIFFVTVLINLILFSWFDFEQDMATKQYSMMTSIGKINGEYLLIGLFIFQMTIITFTFVNSSNRVELLILIAMNLMLVMIYIFRYTFIKEDRYRIVGDSIFYFPALIFFF